MRRSTDRPQPPTSSRIEYGRITRWAGQYAEVVCDKAAPHLREMLLTRGQLGKATVGDAVILTYVSTPSSGLWSVAAVLPQGA